MSVFNQSALLGVCRARPLLHVLVQPLLVGVQPVDAALHLGARRPPLKLEFTAVHHGAKHGQRAGADILTAVMETSHQVGQEPDEEIALINFCTANCLVHAYGTLVQIPCQR